MALKVDIEKDLGGVELKMCFEAGNETLALLGASGSGKSMTLKMIAGIEKPDRGIIELDGVTLFDSERRINLTPQKRRVGMMFQNYALFENMTVSRNIMMGVRNRKQDPSAAKEEVEAIMDCLNITELADRHPSRISGGQQQRVALARILVSHPNILMLDEPFSALDSHLRFQMEQVVEEVIESFGKTVLWVSHNRDEVFRRAQRIAILHRGQIDVIGTRQQVFDDPKTVNAALLTGCKNILPAERIDDHHIRLTEHDVILKAEDVPDQMTHAGLRMNYIRPAKESDTGNRIECDVLEEVKNPFTYVVDLSLAGSSVPFAMMEIRREEWEKIRSRHLAVTIDPDRVLMLQ